MQSEEINIKYPWCCSEGGRKGVKTEWKERRKEERKEGRKEVLRNMDM
jgi:hypothetical protein